MMELDLENDIRSISELKMRPKEVFEHARTTQRPVIVTLNGKAEGVVMNVATYEKLKQAKNVAQTFTGPVAAQTVQAKSTFDPISEQTFRSFKHFWQEFRYAHKVNA